MRKSLADFEAGMTDDLNTPRACAALFGLVKGCEKLFNSDAIDKDGAFAVFFEEDPKQESRALSSVRALCVNCIAR